MSFAIAIICDEGLYLASDRRTTNLLTNKIENDETTKQVEFNDHVSIAFTGSQRFANAIMRSISDGRKQNGDSPYASYGVNDMGMVLDDYQEALSKIIANYSTETDSVNALIIGLDTDGKPAIARWKSHTNHFEIAYPSGKERILICLLPPYNLSEEEGVNIAQFLLPFAEQDGICSYLGKLFEAIVKLDHWVSREFDLWTYHL